MIYKKKFFFTGSVPEEEIERLSRDNPQLNRRQIKRKYNFEKRFPGEIFRGGTGSKKNVLPI